MFKSRVEEAWRKKINGKLETNQIIDLLNPFPLRCCRPTVLLDQPTVPLDGLKRHQQAPDKVCLLLEKENERLLNVIAYSFCQIVRQLLIRTFMDNMWTRTGT